MPQVQISVNGRPYAVGCEPGEEARLAGLARHLESKVARIVKSAGQVGEARLLVLAALLIADELAESEQALAQARAETALVREEVQAEFAAQPPLVQASPNEAVLAQSLESLADKIEAIAATLERDYV